MPDSSISEAKDLASLRGQAWYISRMKATGYTAYDKGHCFGMSYMALQAFLTDDMKTFNDRLYVIASIPVEDFKNDFANLREEQQLLLQNGKHAEAKKIAEIIVDILALFDGIALYHTPKDYIQLFEEPKKVRCKDAAKTMQIIVPVSLDSKDNNPALISCYSGAYTQEDLKQYLAIMEKKLGGNSFALTLNSAGHAINLDYDAKNKQWLLIDPETLPGVEYFDAGLLAKAMLVAFGQSTGLVMETSLYTTHKHANNIQDDFLSMIQTPEWLELHSSSKLDIVFEDGRSQLFHAVFRNDIDWIQQRIALGLNVNQADASGVTPLMMTSYNESVDVAKLLIEKGADVNAIDSAGWTVLQTASWFGQWDIVKLLVEEGADVNVKCYKILPSEKRAAFFDTIKEQLPTILQSLDDYEALREFLDPEQRKLAIHVLTLHSSMESISHLTTSQHANAFAAALISNDNERIKTQVDALVAYVKQHKNRLPETQPDVQLIDILSSVKPFWKNKLISALELPLALKSKEGIKVGIERYVMHDSTSNITSDFKKELQKIGGVDGPMPDNAVKKGC